MSVDKPYCPTCHRRLHKSKAPVSMPCLVCGKPVEGVGFGRPRQLHPACRSIRNSRRVAAYRRRKRAQEVRP